MKMIKILVALLILSTGSLVYAEYGMIPFSKEVSPDLEIGKNIDFVFLGKLQELGITMKAFGEQPPINYQMAESPEVTIEPVGKDAVKQQLQTLSKTENLEGIIFGHIMQDFVKEMVYVIVRVYLVSGSEQYHTFGYEDAMGVKVPEVKPEVIKARFTKISGEIKPWLKAKQLLMEQEGYRLPISQFFIDGVRNLLKANLLKAKFPPEQGPFYVTKLSFINAKTRLQISTEESGLIEEVISDYIVQATKLHPVIKFNAPGHTIKDAAENVNKLIDLIFDPNLTPAERNMKIINEMMEPAGVDIIVTGQFLDEQEKIRVKPIVISKIHQKIFAKSLTFSKADYICTDPVNPKKKVLCSNAYEEIAQALKEILEQL